MNKRIKAIKKIARLCVLTWLGTIAIAAFENELPVKRAPAPKPVAKPVPVPTQRAVQIIKDCADCPDMVVIPGGSFLMGTPDNEKDRFVSEGPQRTVTLQTFAMGRTEVTQGQWKAIMGNNPSKFINCGDDCPVETVSWNDAQEYIKKLNGMTGKVYSLPSEAQWEYSARAGTTTAFHMGNSITAKQANFDAKTTFKVASLNSPNAFGLHDMHGNVWEWTQDVWHDNYTGAPSDGSAWLVGGNKNLRILRGGSWVNNPQYLRSAKRNGIWPAYRYDFNGFRLARTLP
jgi:formylglycine-generating enzyme required for sulfatase activity